MEELICYCGGDVAPTCPIHGEKALERRNDRFYYYASVPWTRTALALGKGRYQQVVDLLGVSVRISYTQSVYIATREEAYEFERIFGPVRMTCDCKQGEKEFRGESILYGGGSNGIYVAGFFNDFDKKRKHPPKHYALLDRHTYEDRLDIDWGDVETNYHGLPSRWEMRLDGERVFSVWHVTPHVMETALLVLAEEPRWKKRLEAYRDAQRRRHGVEVMRMECGLPTVTGVRA
ncbi:MAG: hypothetical protein ACRD1X_22210 [Vicinamibacteria bacterium]